MIEPAERTSLEEFTRDTVAAIQQLKETGQPQVLTIDGEAAIVVQDIASYQRLLDALDRAEAVEAIRRGLAEMARGEGRPVDEVFAELRAKHGFADEE